MNEPPDTGDRAPVSVAEPGSRLTDLRISVVIACFNEVGNIEAMFERLSVVMPSVTSSYELIFVENGSTDGSAAVLATLVAQDAHVHVLSLSRNFGSQGAFSSGLEYATGDAVILLDGDLQDPPELIPQFVGEWLAGNEVVYGERVTRKAPFHLRFAYKAFYRVFTRLSYVSIPVDAGDFGLMDRRVVDILNAMPERNRFIRGLRAWAGFRQCGVSYVREERHSGKSTNSITELFRWASTGLVSFSYAPLELISFLAILVIGLSGIAVVVYIGIYAATRTAPPGFLTLFLAILFLGAVQLVCLSIISAYLAKMFEEIKGRPKFIVDQVLHTDAPPAPIGEAAGSAGESRMGAHVAREHGL